MFLLLFSVGLIVCAFFYVRQLFFLNTTTAQFKGVEISLPDLYSDPLIATRGKDTLTITPLAGNGVVSLGEGNRYTYKNAHQFTDVVQIKDGLKIKEEMIFRQKGHPLIFEFDLGDISSFVIEKDKDGNYIFYNREGYDRTNSDKNLYRAFILSSPFLVDDNKLKSYEAVKSEIVENILTVSLDSKWLDEAVYPVVLDPTIEISVLNIHSHPRQGDDWVVSFTTQGKADLRIIPEDQSTIDDDEFKSLSCDGEEREPQILTGDVIFYPNWECEGVGQIIHYTLKAGKHNLKFDFGGEISFAHNSAPSGIIVAWPGAVGDIPAGWSRVTEMDNMFLSGTSSDPNLGNTYGSSTHSHMISSHSHTRSHTHTNNLAAADGTGINTKDTNGAAAGGHIHPLTVSNATGSNVATSTPLSYGSNNPPFVEVIWIESDGTQDIPDGAWAFFNSDILPIDWATSTMNADKFLKGASSTATTGGATGGASNSHTHTDAGHSHSDTSHTHSTITISNPTVSVGSGGAGSDISIDIHTHTVTDQGALITYGNTSATFSNTDGQPPFYKLNIIENGTGGYETPINTIAIWSGASTTIPAGWEICDGSGVCPNLNSKFVKGASVSNGIGLGAGSNTHTHASSAGHTHTLGSHNHNLTVGNSSEAAAIKTAVAVPASPVVHNHPSSTLTGGNGNTGSDSPTALESTDNRPLHKQIIFIMYTTPPGTLAVSEHAQGQVNNRWIGAESPATNVYYRFNLTNQYEDIYVGTTTFNLSEINGIIENDISLIKLFKDTNSDGWVDGGDSQVGGGNGSVYISGANGNITVATSTSYTVSASTNYILQFTADNLEEGDKLKIDFGSASSTGSSTLAEITPAGTISGILHILEKIINYILEGIMNIEGSVSFE